MSRLKEVKLRVSLFSLGETLQELLSITCYELCCQLNYIAIYVCQNGVANVELIWRIRSNVPIRPSFLRVASEDCLLQLLLERVLPFPRGSCNRRSHNLARCLRR